MDLATPEDTPLHCDALVIERVPQCPVLAHSGYEENRKEWASEQRNPKVIRGQTLHWSLKRSFTYVV